MPKEVRLCLTMYTYRLVKAMSSLFLLGGMPGLASCQPSREPNDSFDPIRIGAKSTLCSLRAGTCQLTTRPPWIRPYVPSSLAQRAPCSPAITKHNHMRENTLLSQRWLKTLCMRQGRVMCSKCAVMFKVTTLLFKARWPSNPLRWQRIPLLHWKRKRKWCKTRHPAILFPVTCCQIFLLQALTTSVSPVCKKFTIFCKKGWNYYF